MEVIISRVKLTQCQNKERAVILVVGEKFYCLHHQSTMHSFTIIAESTKKQCATGASFEKMVENTSFFEVEKAVDKKGVEYFNQEVEHERLQH